ncbi:RidA family protein [Roseibium aestuarii]|uniref:RidA family protein n=1 Tax=Roseibium aestuarii TaxID=2600299 RepID=A0ABW4JSW2_9HYPH|nr:RidA family protein [Roseibium aestuarii]
MSDIVRLDKGPRMSEAVTYNGLVYLAGQVGEPGQSVAEQTATVLKSIDDLLARAGSDKSRILQATIWLADISDFAEMNSVWDSWVDKDNPPARATGESRLAAPDYKVEIIVVAAQKA